MRKYVWKFLRIVYNLGNSGKIPGNFLSSSPNPKFLKRLENSKHLKNGICPTPMFLFLIRPGSLFSLISWCPLVFST